MPSAKCNSARSNNSRGFSATTPARLKASRVATERRRGMRAVYADGIIEIDFMTREVKNTTQRALQPLVLDDPLGESVASFVNSVRLGGNTVVRPEEARRALETALLIDEACRPASGKSAQKAYAALA